MSVFKVALNNTKQGTLDVTPGGVQNDPSIQRTVYVMGPNKINRLLTDGEQFTDCNYWKRFAYPQVPLNEAIMEVVSDDGSVYSDVEGENTYPKVYDVTAVGGTTYTDAANIVDIAGDTGGYAVFTQITNEDSSQDVKMRINGVADAVMDLPANSTQVFNSGDLAITLIEFDDSTSGATDVEIQVVTSIKSVCNS